MCTMDIKIGDTVTLKKGGPEMLVDYIVGHDLPEDCGVFYAPGIKKGSVICKWSNEHGEEQGTMHMPEDLEIVKTAVQIS